MNCADRLVAIFGSQADVARRFRVDRAVVNNWVKSGYVPSRWAVEVEHLTDGKIAAVEVLNEANARKPIRVKSRGEEDSLFGPSLAGSDTMNQFAPAKRIHSFHPPQRTLMGPGPVRDQPARHGGDGIAGDRLSRPRLRRDDGGAQRPAALCVPDQERADFPGIRPRVSRDGILLREPGRARRQGDRVPQRRVRRPHDRERPALRRCARRRRGCLGRSRSIPTSWKTR